VVGAFLFHWDEITHRVYILADLVLNGGDAVAMRNEEAR
jgi:hypothetical protein